MSSRPKRSLALILLLMGIGAVWLALLIYSNAATWLIVSLAATLVIASVVLMTAFLGGRSDS
jgi:hypothetical protein